MNEQLRPILAAEDEETDRFILQLAFRKAKLARPLVLVRDGQEAVDYLRGSGPFSDRLAHPRPVLLVLDLKMPLMNGFDVLAWLSTQPHLKQLPVVMLSSSAHESDISKARQLGAREYFVKPHNINELTEIVQQMQARWMSDTPLPFTRNAADRPSHIAAR